MQTSAYLESGLLVTLVEENVPIAPLKLCSKEMGQIQNHALLQQTHVGT